MEKLDKETFSRWKEWINRIEVDLQHVINYQQIYTHFIDVVDSNINHIKENNGILYCQFVRECFATFAAAGIRRHIKIKKGDISFMRLLDQLKKSANQFTYEYYLEQYPLKENKIKWQERTFVSFSDDGIVLSAEKIEKDMKTIEKIAGKVEEFTDKVIAHLSSKAPKKKIRYKDVTDSLDLFNKMFCKYNILLTSGAYTTLKPTIQYNWERIFTVPLDTQI